MSTKAKVLIFGGVALLVCFVISSSVQAWTPVAVRTDPLVRMPGTQPGTIVFEPPNYCECHKEYDLAVEPQKNWQGSMMSQASRDFLFWSAMTSAAQDSIWAFGRPAATDTCLRCHAPYAWIEGRTGLLNGSQMTAFDFDGVFCEFCHLMWDPFYEDTYAGTREGNDWANYFDESNASSMPSAPAATVTRGEDAIQAASVKFFNGQAYFVNNKPASAAYTESASGQYYMTTSVNRRGAFNDMPPSVTSFNYSRFHKSKYFCGTCHDVSNPILANLGADPSQPLPSEVNPAFSYNPIQRTSSEFMLSTWGQTGGAPGIGPYAPGSFTTSLANNYIAKCQDCHMPEGVGAAARADAGIRPTSSIEHPNSGVPIHDQTGANLWVSSILASTVAGSPNYDATNAQLLGQGPTVLTLDLTQGMKARSDDLLAGVNRIKANLAKTAAVEDVEYDPSTGDLSYRIQNYTPHKILTGYPEGRRMFVNIQVYQYGALIYEINPYDQAAGTLKGLAYPYQADPALPLPAALGANELYKDELVYEVIGSSTLTGEQKTFHSVLADGCYKDNRIPPKGFDIANAATRMAEPVWQGVSAPNYFSASEYAGGYDEVALTIPTGADHVVVSLYMQTTSREYIEFLRNEIKGTGSLTLTSPAPSGEAQAYIVQSDGWFSRLKAWGDTLWNLWKHNKDAIGSAPYPVTEGTWGHLGNNYWPILQH